MASEDGAPDGHKAELEQLRKELAQTKSELARVKNELDCPVPQINTGLELVGHSLSKQTQQAIQANDPDANTAAYWLSLLEAHPDLLMHTDLDLNILYQNRTFSGVPASEIIGKNN